MPLGGLQDELDAILGRRTQRYWVAYLLGIPTLFIYTLVWMANIAEELKAKAIELGMEVIRKDREFREFLKKNPEIPG